MSGAEYKAMQDRIELIARLVLETDADALGEFIAMAEHADTVGAFIDPTLWTRGHDRLRTVIAHARALASFRAVVART